jgi:NAD(P)-dependent dehydrogenase (short-subunit alcohol dehydrogenase family)
MAMSTTQRLFGKAAFLTGGSRGIDAEIAQRLAADGTALALTRQIKQKTLNGKHSYVTKTLRKNRISHGRK